MTFVVLVRHGEAYPSLLDSQRVLTEKGKKETILVAKALKKLTLDFDYVFHSPKLRAKQTAEILAEVLGIGKVIERGDLLPESDPKSAVELIKNLEGKAIICGHLPHLARLFGLLYLGADDDKVIDIKNSGAIGLKKGHRWVLDFVIFPSLLS